VGKVPLPPYIEREANTKDLRDYQTVFAKEPGSVAAPTAGLHFTRSLLDSIRKRGIRVATVTLHIGYDTFAPIRTDRVEDHIMHSESYEISESSFKMIEATRQRGGRIIAVGTTVVRSLESVSKFGLSGNTDLFIRPGFQFRWVDGLITNFHQPKSSLYVLVSAFLGLRQTQASYEVAIADRYRFYSYGDAMAIF